MMPVTAIAIKGVPRDALKSRIGAGNVRSRAIAWAIREAAKRFACSAEKVARTAATMTSQ